jgi:hypothetical protein
MKQGCYRRKEMCIVQWKEQAQKRKEAGAGKEKEGTGKEKKRKVESFLSRKIKRRSLE